MFCQLLDLMILEGDLLLHGESASIVGGGACLTPIIYNRNIWSDYWWIFFCTTSFLHIMIKYILMLNWALFFSHTLWTLYLDILFPISSGTPCSTSRRLGALWREVGVSDGADEGFTLTLESLNNHSAQAFVSHEYLVPVFSWLYDGF